MTTNKRAAAVIIRGRKVLLIQRIRNEQEYYTFPGGHLDVGETPESAVMREVKEELGITGTLGKLLLTCEGLGTLPDGQKVRQEEFFYLLENSVGNPTKISGEEARRQNQGNQYNIVWYAIADARHLPNLFPEKARDMLLKL